MSARHIATDRDWLRQMITDAIPQYLGELLNIAEHKFTPVERGHRYYVVAGAIVDDIMTRAAESTAAVVGDVPFFRPVDAATPMTALQLAQQYIATVGDGRSEPWILAVCRGLVEARSHPQTVANDDPDLADVIQAIRDAASQVVDAIDNADRSICASVNPR